MMDDKSPCPACGKQIDANTAVADGEEGTPSDGDVGVCVYCGQMLWREGDEWRAMTDEELTHMMAEPNAGDFLKALRAVSAYRNG
jgi:uncharacterized protein with PIN domain